MFLLLNNFFPKKAKQIKQQSLSFVIRYRFVAENFCFRAQILSVLNVSTITAAV